LVIIGDPLINLSYCHGTNIENFTYNYDATITDCNITLNNITIQNNANVTFDYRDNMTINGPFEAKTGSTLIIQQ
jgi:hypothetical protein